MRINKFENLRKELIILNDLGFVKLANSIIRLINYNFVAGSSYNNKLISQSSIIEMVATYKRCVNSDKRKKKYLLGLLSNILKQVKLINGVYSTNIIECIETIIGKQDISNNKQINLHNIELFQVSIDVENIESDDNNENIFYMSINEDITYQNNYKYYVYKLTLTDEDSGIEPEDNIACFSVEQDENNRLRIKVDISTESVSEGCAEYKYQIVRIENEDNVELKKFINNRLFRFSFLKLTKEEVDYYRLCDTNTEWLTLEEVKNKGYTEDNKFLFNYYSNSYFYKNRIDNQDFSLAISDKNIILENDTTTLQPGTQYKLKDTPDYNTDWLYYIVYNDTVILKDVNVYRNVDSELIVENNSDNQITLNNIKLLVLGNNVGVKSLYNIGTHDEILTVYDNTNDKYFIMDKDEDGYYGEWVDNDALYNKDLTTSKPPVLD